MGFWYRYVFICSLTVCPRELCVFQIQNVAPYLRWIQWVSVYRYAWGAMLASEMDDQTFLFDVDDFEGARVTMQVSGQTYLNTFALDPRNVNRDILALAAVFVLLAGACWLRLHVRFAMQRRRGGCFEGGWRWKSRGFGVFKFQFVHVSASNVKCPLVNFPASLLRVRKKTKVLGALAGALERSTSSRVRRVSGS